MAPVVARLVAIVPDGEFSVEEKSGEQFHRCDDGGSKERFAPGWQLCFSQFAQTQKADSSRKEHAVMTSAAVKQLQTHISTASDAEKDWFFPFFHDFHPENRFPKNKAKKSEKIA